MDETEVRGGWIEGLRLLQSRNASIPSLLRETLDSRIDEAAIAASIGPAGVVATGVGSSAAHARFLASVLGDLGVAARFVPLTAFLEPSLPSRATLVVFSQGLSPNARLALDRAKDWHATWLCTATGSPVAGPAPAVGGDDDARRRALDDAVAGGVRLLSYPGSGEYGTLLRMVGPMTGYAAALRFAMAIARAGAGGGATPSWIGVPAGDVCRAVAVAGEKLAREAGDVSAADLESNVVFVASGQHAARVDNLRLKLLEGLLVPAVPVWDVLDLAHGPFQQMIEGRATLLVLARADAAGEADLVARLASMLDERRHRLVRLESSLAGPLAVFEHEALANELVLRCLEERKLDPRRWPGRNEDAPLYSFGAAARDDSPADAPASCRGASTESPATDSADSPGRSLEGLTWPELEDFLQGGARTAILPLGSIEQHGPHLPFATDAWIAGELARRLGSRLPEAIVLPVVPLGCASEHLGFSGTLSLEEETLARVLADVAASVARHGFARLFVFSAHGGNRRALELALPGMLGAAGKDLEVLVAPGVGATTESFHASSARHGVAADASGQHAGEFETSILMSVAPQSVRTRRLARGLAAGKREADSIFYPDLRANAPDGTVGDPTGADASRANAYLDAWVESLLEFYRAEASRDQTKGRKNA